MVISNNRSLLSPKNRSLGIFLKRARRKTSSLDDDSREKESGRASKTTEPGRLRGGNDETRSRVDGQLRGGGMPASTLLRHFVALRISIPFIVCSTFFFLNEWR